MAGGSADLVVRRGSRRCLGCASGFGSWLVATVLGGCDLATATALAAEPQVAGPLPSRSLASIQYSLSPPPAKLVLKTSSKSFLTMGESSTFPPGLRWWQMAESTPVSSVMRASTWTCPPRAAAFTSEICGGLVSSARAADAAANAATGRPSKYAWLQDIADPTTGQLRKSGCGGAGLGELDRDDLGDARLLHGHAVERVGH